MKTNKQKTIKKTITIATSLLLGLGALGGIAYGSYSVSQSTYQSNDFTNGRSLQINLRLYKTDETGKYETDTNGNLIPVFADSKLEIENLKTTALAVTNFLQKQNLTNIQVSYGYSAIQNVLLPTINKTERIGALYIDFENSQTAFGLNDISESVNSYINNQKIYTAISKNTQYKIEQVKPSYSGSNYRITGAGQNTGRVSDSLTGIYFNSVSKVASGNVFDLQSGNDTSAAIKPYTGDVLLGSHVSVTSKQDLNSWAFVVEKKEYDAIASTETASLQSTIFNQMYADSEWYSNNGNVSLYATTPKDAFQTKYSWLMWPDKEGLINYLNSLVVLWYYNIYANQITTTNNNLTKDDLDDLFPTSSSIYSNYVDPDTRDKINVVINDLSDTEKSFMALLAQSTGGSSPAAWWPSLITENDLIPVLYNFYNSKAWNADYVDPKADSESVPEYGNSESVKNGWGWIESSNTSALSTLLSDYAPTKIDYRKYADYFYNPNATERESSELLPFTTAEFNLSVPGGYTPDTYSGYLNNNYKFNVISPLKNEFVNNFTNVDTQIKALNKRAETENIDFKNNSDPKTIAYKKDRNILATKYFNANNIFSQQAETRPQFLTSWTTFNPFDILLIVLSIILFLIAVFISVRYRVPGVLASLIACLVFIISTVLYSAFGFVFSFNTFIALIIGTFISLLSPIFLFRNTQKEIKENSSLNGSIVKSVKKYWKTSLDMHVISILSALSFLFFGSGGNINFGAMLIISVFLSFILSGIIFFILMLFYTQYAQFNTYTWFFQKRHYNYIISMANNKPEEKKHKRFGLSALFTSKIKLFNLKINISLIGFFIAGLVGVVVISTIGSVFSLDFNSANILIINNFSQFNLSQNEIVSILQINAIQSYVFNNEFIIYTTQNFDILKITEILNANGVELNTISDNVLFTTLTTSIAIDNVINTIKCMGIALGFCAVWAIISLNIVSILPLAFAQILPVFIFAGFMGITQIPIDLSVLPVFTLIFMLSGIIAATSLSCIKSSWNREIKIQKEDLKSLVESILSKITSNYTYFIWMFIALSLLALIFGTVSLMVTWAVAILGLLWVSFFVNRIVVLVWYWSVIFRDKFNKELIYSRKQENLKLEYDLVDEQLISGINH